MDYGVGNLFSVCHALEYCGCEVNLAMTSKDIDSAERLVLPGVGAFSGAMAEIEARGLTNALQAYAASTKPFLGICVGMQVMFGLSEEQGTHYGLGLLRGQAKKIPAYGIDGKRHPVPHIGWSPLQIGEQEWAGTILEGIGPDDSVYFLHSYAIETDPQYVLATTNYNGISLVAAVRDGNRYGCQFHPEKSGKIGLAIFQRFVKLNTQ